jgi:SAM-dependent methyltransferase
MAAWANADRVARYAVAGNRVFYAEATRRLVMGARDLVGNGLDLGCGCGFSTQVLCEQVPRVVWRGVDVSSAMIDSANASLGARGVEFARAEADHLPFADASFEIVVSNFSWHWFGKAAGLEVRRILRPGGLFMATLPLRSLSTASGNRAVARALLARRARFRRRISQGVRFEEIARILPGQMEVVRRETTVESESFPDGVSLLATLRSRGVLLALFGEDVELDLGLAGAVDYEWPTAMVWLRKL